MAVLTTALARLRADFNTRFPKRDKASDGWIGDAAHQREISGHNPDETGGGEYEDADSKDEVRAIDVDVDFRDPVTAQQVVDAVLRTPADLARLRYVIYNRLIWSRNTGWQPRAYTGASAHKEHIHFSGDPAEDENDAPWLGVLTAGDDMATPQEVWGADIIPSGDPANPTWGAAWAFGELLRRAKDAKDKAASADAKADTVAGQVSQLITIVNELAQTPPGAVVITDEQLERVLRQVIGSVDQVPGQ